MPQSDGIDNVRDLGSIVADRYVLTRRLGSGRYGEIYEAVDRSLSDPLIGQEHRVALHLLDERIAQQTRLLQKIESSYQQPYTWAHPNVLTMRGFGCDDGQYFFVIELLDGVSLRSILNKSQGLPAAEMLTSAVLRGVGDALDYAHAKGVIHGDIRPEKIFITSEHVVKVLDLLPGSSARALPFFVEEQNGLDLVDRRDDVYGLACVAYELFAGRHPFAGKSPLEALNAGLTPAPMPRLTARRWDALARGLALRREHRTPSIDALLAELGIPDAATLRPGGEPAASAPPPAGTARLASAAGSASTPRSASADTTSLRATRAHDDDMPVIGDFSAAWDVSTRRAAPLPPLEQSDAQRRELGEFEGYADFAPRRERGESSRSGVRFATVAVLVVAAAAAVYWSYEPLRERFAAWLPADRTADENAPNDAEPPAPIEGEEAVVAPQIAIATPEVRSDTGAAPPAESPRVAVPPPDAPLVVTPPTDAPADAPFVAGPPDAPAAEPPDDAEPQSARLEQDDPLPAAELAAERAAELTTEPAAENAAELTAEAAAELAGESTAEPAAELAAAPAAEPAPAPAVEPAPPASPPEPETFEFVARVVTVSEADAVATATIRRRGGDRRTSSVIWWATDGSASADDDYADLGELTESFAAGEDRRSIRVPIIGDARVEGQESFYVNIRGSDELDSELDPAHRVEIVIADDD